MLALMPLNFPGHRERSDCSVTLELRLRAELARYVCPRCYGQSQHCHSCSELYKLQLAA